MEKTLEDLPASTLRNLLIEEVKRFIVCLDKDTTEELEQMKAYLRKIYDLISIKEKEETALLVWGKNSLKMDSRETKALSKEDKQI